MSKYYKNQIVGQAELPSESIIGGNSAKGTRIDTLRHWETEKVLFSDPHIEEHKLNEIKKDIKVFSDRFVVRREIKMIHVNNLYPPHEHWNPFPPMKEEDAKLMKYSIEKYDILQPGIVIDQGDDKYMMLDGFERSVIQTKMWEETGDERYEYFPCYSIPRDEINDLIARDIIIDANFNKKCDKETLKKVIIMKLGIESAKKTRKNDINIYRKVGDDLGFSESTIYNYHMLENCTINILRLLDIGQISLTSARKMSKYSREVQDDLLRQFGIDEMRNAFIKALPSKVEMKEVAINCKIFKKQTHPMKLKIVIEGYFDETMELFNTIIKMKKEKGYRQMRVKLKNEHFDFMTGHKELGNYEMVVPNYFLEHLEDV